MSSPHPPWDLWLLGCPVLQPYAFLPSIQQLLQAQGACLLPTHRLPVTLLFVVSPLNPYCPVDSMLYACSFYKTVLRSSFIVNLHTGLLVRAIRIKFLSSYLYGCLSRHKPIGLQFNVVTYTQETKDKTTVLENS